MTKSDDRQPEEMKIGEKVLSGADKRGHGNATRRSAAGAAVGALVGSFGVCRDAMAKKKSVVSRKTCQVTPS